MSTPKIWLLALTIVLCGVGCPGLSYANEHGDEHAEPKAEEHGGGGHEESGHGESGHGEAKTSLAPWVEIENKITELGSKVKTKEANIRKLIEEKNHAPNNSPELTAIVKEIIKEHREMRSLVEQYDKNLTLLKYRFPERNAKVGRTYDRIEVKSVDEMEQAIGVDGKLNRNLRKMRTQFKPEESPAERHSTSKNIEPVKAESKDPSIEEAHTIILQK